MKRWLNTLLPALIALSWQGSPDAVGYRIYYGSQPGVYSYKITVPTNVTSRTVSVTVSPTPKYFVVKAFNDWGESAASNELKIGPATAPKLFQCTNS